LARFGKVRLGLVDLQEIVIRAKLDSIGDYILNGSKVRLGQIRLIKVGMIKFG
jgi:hypothetical protein